MLKLERIVKSFDGINILNNLSLEIPKGQIVSILGPSGSGKTTLLNLILGISEVDSGRIIFEIGFNLCSNGKRGFNIVFQDYALFPNLNAYENITYGLKNKPDISTKEEVE
ncbi:MAG: ATP-binding cassette domain-containing protein [Thomasclavelia ramosa]